MPGSIRKPAHRRESSTRRAIAAFVATAILTVPVSVLASCARKKPVAAQGLASPQAGATQPFEGQAPQTGLQANKVSPPAALPPPPPRPAQPPAAPLTASIRAFGLRVPSNPRIASDYSLGPLQSSRPAPGDEAMIYKAASTFSQDFAAGKLDADLLLPQAKDALSALLVPAAQDPAAKAPPASPRLGAIVIQGQDASLRLRLSSASASPRVEGLLSLRKVGEDWYVDALSLDPPGSGTLSFNPDTSSQPR